MLEVREKHGDKGTNFPQAKLGFFASKADYLHNASLLQHPFDAKSAADDVLLKAVFALLTLGPDEVARKREEAFRHYEARSAELEASEKKCHDSVPAGKRELIAGKRFLLLQEMARDAGYTDESLAELGLGGTRLTGVGHDVPAQPARPCGPAVDPTFIMHATKFTRPANMAVNAGGDAGLLEAVYQVTCEEREKGWLDKAGPFSLEELEVRLGPLFVVNKRFGINQGEKVRAIDNYSSSFVNFGYSSPWKLELGG